MSTASRKGYSAEHAIELLLNERGLDATRPRAGRAQDCGDFGGVPMVISAKNWADLRLATWVTDLERLVLNADARSGVVWHKRKGRGDPRDWYVTTTGRLYLPLLDLASDAGWDLL
jgi:hypothetical protein